MRLTSKFSENPIPGIDVFITFVTKQGERLTRSAILRPLGRDVYGASLDPDAEDVYEIAEGFQADCVTLLARGAEGECVSYKIWRNGPEGTGNEVFQDCELDEPVCILSDEVVHIPVTFPCWLPPHTTTFDSNYFRS